MSLDREKAVIAQRKQAEQQERERIESYNSLHNEALRILGGNAGTNITVDGVEVQISERRGIFGRRLRNRPVEISIEGYQVDEKNPGYVLVGPDFGELIYEQHPYAGSPLEGSPYYGSLSREEAQRLQSVLKRKTPTVQ